MENDMETGITKVFIAWIQKSCMTISTVYFGNYGKYNEVMQIF